MKPAVNLWNALAVFLLAVLPLAAADLTVTCGSTGAYTTVQSAVNYLNSNNPNGPNTIFVSGSCTEAVSIEGLRHLVVVGSPGGAIAPPSTCPGSLVTIADSHIIVLRNLSIHGAGECHPNLVRVVHSNAVRIEDSTLEQGHHGAWVDMQSNAVIKGVTSKDNTGSGVEVSNSSTAELQGISNILACEDGIRATTNSNVTIGGTLTVENIHHYGVYAIGSNVTLQGCQSGSVVRNALVGLSSEEGWLKVYCPISVEDNRLYGAMGGGFNLGSGVIVQRNGPPAGGSSGGGVFVFGGEELGVSGAKIINNYGPGVEVNRGSNAIFAGATTITGNQREGITLTELSVAGFLEFYGPNQISGNGGADLACDASSHGYGDFPAQSKMKCPSFNAYKTK